MPLRRRVPNTAISQYRKKNWHIPKYRVQNRRNPDTAVMIAHAYLKLYPSRVFVYHKHVWPEINRGHFFELIGTTIEKGEN